MTTVWGPLGWMMLHSVATSYPENPTQSEKSLLYSWLDLFRDTITCATCKGHFSEMLQIYRTKFPNMLASRQDFAIFSFRAHNAVNKRLSKPIYSSVDECMSLLKGNIRNNTSSGFRVSYINHITRYWKTLQDVSGIVALKKILEMKRIEIEYISSRDTSFAISILPDVVVLPSDALEHRTEASRPRGLFGIQQPGVNARVGLQLGVGGFRIRR